MVLKDLIEGLQELRKICGEYTPVVFCESTSSNAWFYPITDLSTEFPTMDRIIIHSQRNNSGKPGQKYNAKDDRYEDVR